MLTGTGLDERAGPPRSLLHLVASESAAGLLRAACRDQELPDEVISCPDDLTQGPLVEGPAREALERALHEANEEPHALASTPFACWDTVLQTLNLGRTEGIAIWGGENVTDVIFLALACHRLAQRLETLWHVQVPGLDRPYVQTHSPTELAALLASGKRLAAADRAAWAAEFVRIRDTCGPLRQLRSGAVIGASVDALDHLMLGACNDDWQPAARVIGVAMSQCDAGNLMSDGFFALRLLSLSEAGIIEIQANESGPGRLRRGFVRLA